MKGILRRDITLGNSSYFKRLNQLKDLVADMATDPSGSVIQGMGIGLRKYADTLGNFERMRIKEQGRIINFLGQQKSKKEKKFAFIFYEREVKPDITSSDLQKFQEQYKNDIDIIAELQSLFELYKREVAFNLKKIKKKFVGLNVLVNFVNYKSTSFHSARGVDMREYPEDAVELFTTLVQISGGMKEYSANPIAFFTKAQSYSGQFYSLQYVSSNPEKDKKKLRKIEIKIKNKNYKVYHRLGY
jgi:hypothetical protein